MCERDDVLIVHKDNTQMGILVTRTGEYRPQRYVDARASVFQTEAVTFLMWAFEPKKGCGGVSQPSGTRRRYRWYPR
ncbi:hypothetical protein ABIB80_007232 [Bradyrhizobium sp. i1.15.2]